MNKITTTLAIAALAFTAVQSNDAQAEVPYGPAGCGLGHMVVGADPGIKQIFAMTTNGVFGNQMFGITTGTLGCDVGGTGSAMIFIQSNREAVAKDMSRGSGDTLSSLAEIGGCSDSEALSSYLQTHFDVVFSDVAVSDQAVGERVVALMQDNENLQCTEL
jgi:hypothetical protein